MRAFGGSPLFVPVLEERDQDAGLAIGPVGSQAARSHERIPFNRPYVTGNELSYVAQAIENAHLSGGGPFAQRCTDWLVDETGCAGALLTHSGTGALELAATLAGIEPGDEIIMPSFTFPSTANAFVLQGGTPVFVDIRPDTHNLDETLVEAAITDRTKAIVPVHYGGVGCEMDALQEIAVAHDLTLIEDAAHAAPATYDGRPLGAIGDLGAISFHETKNLTCGEGGALLLRDERWLDRAAVIYEKGTTRRRFMRGEVRRYEWADVGSSYSPSEITAAFLFAQFEAAAWITSRRLAIWDEYHSALATLELAGLLQRPIVPAHCRHGAHLYSILVSSKGDRDRLIQGLRERGIDAVFHYVPLHSSTAGRRYGRAHGELEVTESTSRRLVRLPLWVGMRKRHVHRVAAAVAECLDARYTTFAEVPQGVLERA